MKITERMKTYNFWISLASAVLLILRIAGSKFGFTVDSAFFIDIVTALCGVFVICGIISPTSSGKTSSTGIAVIDEEIKKLSETVENKLSSVLQLSAENDSESAEIVSDTNLNVESTKTDIDVALSTEKNTAEQSSTKDDESLTNLTQVDENPTVIEIVDENLICSTQVDKNPSETTNSAGETEVLSNNVVGCLKVSSADENCEVEAKTIENAEKVSSNSETQVTKEVLEALLELINKN